MTENIDSSVTQLLSLGSCDVGVLHGTYKTEQKWTELEFDKLLKRFFSIFKKSLARPTD